MCKYISNKASRKWVKEIVFYNLMKIPENILLVRRRFYERACPHNATCENVNSFR